MDWFSGLTGNAQTLVAEYGVRVLGVLVALFIGWVVPVRRILSELGLGPWWERLLCVGLRYVVPAGIVAAALAPLTT